MVKRKYKEVDTSTEGGGYDGEQPRPAIYPAKLVEAGEHTGDSVQANTSKWVFEIDDKDSPFNGWRGWVYTNDDSTAWREVQILVALGVIDEADVASDGTFSGAVNFDYADLIDSPVRIRTRKEKYEGEDRAKIRTVLAPEEGAKKSSKKKGGKKKRSQDTDDEPF